MQERDQELSSAKMEQEHEEEGKWGSSNLFDSSGRTIEQPRRNSIHSEFSSSYLETDEIRRRFKDIMQKDTMRKDRVVFKHW